jgi:hypothetical protein
MGLAFNEDTHTRSIRQKNARSTSGWLVLFWGGYLNISNSPVCNWDAFESTPDGRACTAHSISIFSSDTNVTYEKRHFSFNMEKRHVFLFSVFLFFCCPLTRPSSRRRKRRQQKWDMWGDERRSIIYAAQSQWSRRPLSAVRQRLQRPTAPSLDSRNRRSPGACGTPSGGRRAYCWPTTVACY